MNYHRFLVLATLLGATIASAQDAAPADRNAVNSKATPGDMMADSPVQFPKSGALPAQFPPDTRADTFDPGEQGYYLFSNPPRSLEQIKEIQSKMPGGRFTPPANDWKHLQRTRRILTGGGALHIMAIGDSIVNDTMRSGWIALLREAYPKAEITATVYVRGGGGCQHFIEEDRLAKHVIPRKPDLVFIGGISQKGLEPIGEVVDILRPALPETEFLLATGAFGTADPRHPGKLAAARHSGTGAYGRALRELAGEKRCAYLDLTSPWAAYINSSGLHPHRFYRDAVHANEFGEQILAKILMAFWKGSGQSAMSGVKRLLIDRVPAGFPVRFCLLTANDRQHVAYYNAERQMTVASRQLGEDTWTYTHLPSKVGWDSHNSLVMALDDDGHIHLSGNMHCVPLIYFRTTRPGDASSLVRVETMVGPEEDRCTYPHFMRGPKNELIFHYRIGGSGRGNEIYNVYDHETKTWSRLLDKPLTDGRGQMNAYMHGPVKGPDGFYHLVWVWRNTPDCATNHDLSYARSPDLRSWETIAGEPAPLPLTLDDKRLVVDPVQPGGGIINGCAKIGFAANQQVIITYHKFDAKGITQAYAARFNDGQWRSRPISDWGYRWEFGGGGSINFEIGLGSPTDIGHGRMQLAFTHKMLGKGNIMFDADTLLPLPPDDPRRKLPLPPKKPFPRVPPALGKPTSDFPGLGVQWAGDSGKPSDPGTVYRLRWETLPRNRDRPRTGKLPAPSRLELIALGMTTKVPGDDDVPDFDVDADPATEPLSHLVEAVESLKAKTIPQAYFLLSSPQVPAGTIFLPDTKGGAYVRIARAADLPDGTSAEEVLAEINEAHPDSIPMILDRKRNRLLFYSEEAWIHLMTTLKPWAVAPKKIAPLDTANPFWQVKESDLVIKIPNEKVDEFYRALMKAWQTDRDSFRCFADWN